MLHPYHYTHIIILFSSYCLNIYQLAYNFLRSVCILCTTDATTFCLASTPLSIGRGSEFVWPPRSPDLNPLNFSIWSNLKNLVYQQEINYLQELRQRIQEAANTF
ncbi:hypothetical protein NQ318_012431 [Aromia moschata]|uniref:Tc1-like transposase DDE domain-containing protein n=1 Tax=Aromia moschata TaxID=1265417 RepID=A0AAV8XJM4_9CUCU|nr:hypothetical protein NQ318_012431 [Aromia moschata]